MVSALACSDNGPQFYFQLEEEECLHAWVKVEQAGRPLPPKSLSILVGLALKLASLCIIVNVVESIWTFCLFSVFSVNSLGRFDLIGISRNVKI